MSRRLVFSLVGLVAAAVLLAELLLQPADDDRWHLIVILVAPALAAVALTPLLARWVSTRASVAGAALTVGLCSLTLGAASSSAASNAMFVSTHDYRLFLVVLLMSSGIALVVGSQLTQPLARDVRRLGDVAEQVAAGDLAVRTGIVRNDEVGTTAAALDQMIDALRAAESDRERLAAARQHLFTSIGHDLRTPLSAMRAALEGIEDGLAPDPERYLAVLAAQLRAVDAMLDQLIELSRLESGHTTATMVRLSLTELADETVEALGPLAHQRGITLQVSADGPATVTGSPLELSRVIRNLVDNAVRHSPEGEPVTIALASAADAVHLTVRDRGAGFPAEFRDHAFEPFQRADPSRNASTGNSGLGLAICKAIVEAHRGRIWLGTGPGGEVHVSLPITDTVTPDAPNGAPT